MEPEGPSVGGRVADFWFTMRPLLLALVFVGASLYVNEAVIQYRMAEFYKAMESVSRSYHSSHSLGMLARLELIRQREKLPEEDQAVLEARLSGVASTRLVQDTLSGASWKTRGVAAIIKVIGLLLGKKRHEVAVEPELAHELEQAYLMERARRYDEAVNLYAAALRARLGQRASITALQHRAFCLSMLGEYEAAKNDLESALKLSPSEEEAKLCRNMAVIVTEMESRVSALMAKSPDAPGSISSESARLERGRRMFEAGNYGEAIRDLVGFLDQGRGSVAEERRAKFFLGRAYEELGQEDYALEQYRELEDGQTGDEWAKRANRRLYMLGKYYQRDEKMATAALKRIEDFKDFGFINRLQAKLAPVRAKAKSVDDAISAFNTEINTAVGGQQLEAVDPNIPALDANPLSPSVGEQVEVKLNAPTLRKTPRVTKSPDRLIANPRRKDQIATIIAANRSDLQFLYQKWLRKGTPFHGILTIKIWVTPQGDVRNAQIVDAKSDISIVAFREDILKSVKRWKFREDAGSDFDIPVSFPVRFVRQN